MALGSRDGFTHVVSFDQPVVRLETIKRGDREIVRAHLADGTIADIFKNEVLAILGDA